LQCLLAAQWPQKIVQLAVPNVDIYGGYRPANGLVQQPGVLELPGKNIVFGAIAEKQFPAAGLGLMVLNMGYAQAIDGGVVECPGASVVHGGAPLHALPADAFFGCCIYSTRAGFANAFWRGVTRLLLGKPQCPILLLFLHRS
jgi:hypothetical protein